MLKQFYQILGQGILKLRMKIHRRLCGYNKILFVQTVTEYYNTYSVRNSSKKLMPEMAAKKKFGTQLKFLFVSKADTSKDILLWVPAIY